MSDLTDDAWAEGLGAPMTTDLEAAVARLKRDLATPGTVTGCVVDGNHLRLLLADWKRQGKMLDVCSVVHDHNVKLKAERDAARAEVERLKADAARVMEDTLDRFVRLETELARLREDLQALRLDAKVFCAGCGIYDSREAIRQHALTCEQHPLRPEFARLRERDARVQTKLANVVADLTGVKRCEILRAELLALLKETP